MNDWNMNSHMLFWIFFQQGTLYHGLPECKSLLIPRGVLSISMNILFLCIYIVILNQLIFWSTRTFMERFANIHVITCFNCCHFIGLLWSYVGFNLLATCFLLGCGFRFNKADWSRKYIFAHTSCGYIRIYATRVNPPSLWTFTRLADG